jgi:hypothetical protein
MSRLFAGALPEKRREMRRIAIFGTPLVVPVRALPRPPLRRNGSPFGRLPASRQEATPKAITRRRTRNAEAEGHDRLARIYVLALDHFAIAPPTDAEATRLRIDTKHQHRQPTRPQHWHGLPTDLSLADTIWARVLSCAAAL